MKLVTLREYAKKDPTKKPNYISALAVATAIFTLISLGGYAFLQVEIERLDQVETEINEIHDFIAQTEQKERQYQDKVRFGAKPVPLAAVDQVQADLLQKMRGYGLTFQETTLQSSTTTKAAAPANDKAPQLPGMEYQVTIMGPWEASMNYLREIQEGPALLNIRSVHSENNQANPQLVRTTVRYKIYTETGGKEL